jgi:hypothetical protein
MAAFCVVGKIKELGLGTGVIVDLSTGEEFKCNLNTETLSVGQQGAFTGELVGNKISVKHATIRKFLDPLYEEDLFEASGKFTLIQPVDNPFPELWEELNKENENEN